MGDTERLRLKMDCMKLFKPSDRVVRRGSGKGREEEFWGFGADLADMGDFGCKYFWGIRAADTGVQ